MNVLSLVPFVKNGHFDWCPAERTAAQRDCQRCQWQLYLFALLTANLIAALEFWGGGHTGSVSLMSDAWHVVSDGFGYLIGAVYVTLTLYRVGGTRTREKFQHLCEFFLGGFLVITAFSIGSDTIDRLWQGRVPVIEHSWILFWTAFVGLIANVALFLLFLAFDISHHHNHDHEAEHSHEHSGGNKILSGNLWHTFTDTVSSVLVILNGVIFSFTHNVNWRYLDLVVSLIIATVLLWQGLKILEKT